MKKTFRSCVARCGLMLMAVLLCTIPSLAQQTLGSINGTVVDPSGAAVPGATVIATNAAINVTSTTTSSSKWPRNPNSYFLRGCSVLC